MDNFCKTADPVVGPPIHIDVEMVVKAITKMKTGKAAGPSGIVAEMLKVSGDTGARLVADLANDMVRNGAIPSDWEDSFITNIYKGKGDALERGNYRGLKLLDHVMKGIKRVIEKIIRERISIDDMQFGFMPGHGTTDAIFILRQLQEKHLAKNKKLYFAFVDLEKAFDRVPRKVIWWAMRKLGIEEWIVRFVQAMYNNTRSRVESITPTVMNLESKLEFTRVRYLALSYSSLYSKLCLASSVLGHPGSCCMLMT